MKTIYCVAVLTSDSETSFAFNEPEDCTNFLFEIKDRVLGVATWTAIEFPDGSFVEDNNYHQEI